MRRIKSHLTFANLVMAILAFSVLGGGAWAAKSGKLKLPKNAVKSKQIKNRSIQSVDVNPKFRSPYLRVSGTVGSAKASVAEASARSIFAETAADTAANLGSRVNVSPGAVEAFLTSPPFTFSLGCNENGSVGLLVTSSAAGWSVSSQPGSNFDAGQTVQVDAVGLSLGEFRPVMSMQQTLKDANGQVTTLNTPSVGREADGTCWVQDTAAGSTPTP